MSIAILGGGGCFGLNFAKHLDAAGIEHCGVGRSQKPKAFWLVEHPYRFYRLHLVDEFDAVMALLDSERPTVIVNYAAQGEGAASFGDNAPDFFRTNTWGLSRLATELRKRDYLERFIHISTSELYGPVEWPAKEFEDGKGTSPYAISKQAFDDVLKGMWKNFKFPMNIIRPSNAYTPGQQLYRVIPKAIVCALKGEKLPLHGGGRAQKSYIHADDLSKAVLAVIEKGAVGKIYNCGPQSPISIRALVAMVAEACGIKFDDLVTEVPDRMGQDSKYWLDSTEIGRDCGWMQTVGLESGLEGMVSWVRAFPELLTYSTTYEHRQ